MGKIRKVGNASGIKGYLLPSFSNTFPCLLQSNLSAGTVDRDDLNEKRFSSLWTGASLAIFAKFSVVSEKKYFCLFCDFKYLQIQRFVYAFF